MFTVSELAKAVAETAPTLETHRFHLNNTAFFFNDIKEMFMIRRNGLTQEQGPFIISRKFF